MSSRISYNIHAQAIPDRAKLFAHLMRINPPAVLFMDGLEMAIEATNALPNCVVIHRRWPDEQWIGVGAADWVNKKLAEIENSGVWCYTFNEVGFSDAYLKLTTNIIIEAAKRGLRVVVGNMSVGTPAPEDWLRPAAQELLTALDKHRDTAILGLHEYACGVITSGLLGGYPDNAGVPPGQPGGRNLIPPTNWPKKPEIDNMTRWHMGRFKFMVDTCKTLGIRPPRVLMTEHGFDDVSDIKGWSQTLPKTPPDDTIRGWKSCVNAWSQWWGQSPGWSPERALFEQLTYADKNIYQGSVVEAQLIFCWGRTSDQWTSFDVSRADEFHMMLENYARAGTPTPPIPPTAPPVPPPSPVIVPLPETMRYPVQCRLGFWNTSSSKEANLRPQPSVKAGVTTVLKNGQITTVWQGTTQFADDGESKHYWVWVDTGKVQGWVAKTNNLLWELLVDGTIPLAPASDELLERVKDQLAVTQAKIMTARQTLSEALQLGAKDK